MKIKIIIKNILAVLIAFLFTITAFAMASHQSIPGKEIKPFTTPKKLITITIDDLPFVGEYRNFHLNMIIDALTHEKVPATGFIIANEIRKDNWEILQKFRGAGLSLGNHTLTHANLAQLKPQGYIREIQESDNILAPILTKPKYFRYPYLSMGSGQRREDILCFLAQKHYQVAPVTVDSKDFAFNQRLFAVPELGRRAYLEELKPFYLDFIWQQTLRAEKNNPQQAQILLIHANLLNAYVLPDIIRLYKENGYTFVSLKKALKTFKNPGRCSNPQLHSHVRLHLKKASPIEDFMAWD